MAVGVYFSIDADISDAQKEELVRMAQKYPPVFQTMADPIAVSVRLDQR
jgi:hypothetical protein